MWKRTSTKYGKTPAPETAYQKAAQVWDDRMGGAVKSVHSWKLGTFGAGSGCDDGLRYDLAIGASHRGRACR